MTRQVEPGRLLRPNVDDKDDDRRRSAGRTLPVGVFRSLGGTHWPLAPHKTFDGQTAALSEVTDRQVPRCL